MSKMIQIRNVPDEVHRTLKSRAAAEGLSLSDYIKKDLVASAKMSSLEETLDRIEARRIKAGGGVSTQEIVDVIREQRGPIDAGD